MQHVAFSANNCNSNLNHTASEFVPNPQKKLSQTNFGPQPLQVSSPQTQTQGCESVSPCLPVYESSAGNVFGSESQQIQDLVRSFSQLVNISRLPVPEPGVFEGDPLEYPSWRSAFSTLIDRRDIAPAERVHYLRRYLAGEARQCVENFLLIPSDDSYHEAIKLIEKRFGNSFSIAQAFKSKIETWPKVSAKDYTGLRKFSDFLRQCEVSYRSNPSLRVLDDDVQNRVILSKLPDWIVTKWA